MKEYLIFVIFLFIHKKGKTTAKEISNNFEISQRSVYRYIDALSLAGIPILTKQGKYGGVELLENFKLNSLLLTNNEKKIIKEFIENGNISDEIFNILNKII